MKMSQTASVTGTPKCDVVAARIRINQALEVRVLAQDFKGRCLIHIREFALNADNQYVPTAKGIAVGTERLEQVLDFVRELRGLEAGSENPGLVIETSPTQQLRFGFATWQGATKADIRSYYKSKGASEWSPGKGLRFNLALLAELERGLEALDRLLTR